MNKEEINRRNFLKTMAAGSAACSLSLTGCANFQPEFKQTTINQIYSIEFMWCYYRLTPLSLCLGVL